MRRLTLLALCAAGLVGACNARRTTERLALDTSLTPVPLAAASGVPAAIPVAGVVYAARPTAHRDADAEVSPVAAKTFLLWARDSRGQNVTYHLDRSGEELERLDGVYIGTRSGSWQWREEDIAVPTKACDHSEEDGAPPVVDESPPPGHATRVTLALTAPGTRVQRIVDPLAPMSGPAAISGHPEATTDIAADPIAAGSAEDHGRSAEEGDLIQNAEDVRHTVSLAGSIGPYLFIEESTYAFTCGAHGNTSVSARIWNVASGQIEPMPTDFGSLNGALAKAAQELNEQDDPFPATDENLELTALVPRYGQRASLRLGLQLTAPTCYACTRGGYGSYTKSTVVDSAALPKVFARYASAPGPVRTWVAAHPDEHLGGFSGLGW
jgi:hypothetical protein